ncbi:Lyso-phosphatidylcholine acyltransferase [Ophidiomyces ophidiicola]|nr:Lyso-phosphatidylcholine acyltransferase [Ophidiomyces ophidiicola]
MFQVAALCRGFLYALNTTEIHGQDAFLQLLEERRDHTSRKRGLITVSNHISVMDDPIMWGAIPLHNHWGYKSFNCRLNHSTYGGLFQPTVTQAIRLLSKGPFPVTPHAAPEDMQQWSLQNVCVDPFSEVAMAYTTTGHDSYLAPSAYACNAYSWVHIFPEGKVHQSPSKTMRYFKWGVSRLILEASECPDVVPMWIDGTDEVMHESRTFPRFLPRINKNISITFGKKADVEDLFGDLRRRWQKLKSEAEGDGQPTSLGVLNKELMYGQEAVELRKECTMRVRELVLQVRSSTGLPNEDPKASLAETWAREGGGTEGKMDDDSWVRDV